MKARDVMTKEVATVAPEASVREAASLMTDRRISGLPVVGREGELVGMLTASDLLHRVETGTEQRESWFRSFFADPDQMARRYAKAHGMKVHEVMSRHVISVREDASLSQVADTLDSNKLKRVPVIGDGVLVGIISRSDLVRALSQASLGRKVEKSDDATLHRRIMQEIRKMPWLDSGYLNVTVSGGVVEAWGMVRSSEQRNALQVLLEEIPGVARIDDHIKVGIPANIAGAI
jgi:CBS domain-containing protein